MDESRWRYDLYKTWLVMLDEGVGGENPLYEYGDRPREGRRRPPPPSQSRGGGERENERSPPPRPKRRQQQRRRPENGGDDDYDEEYGGREAPPTPRRTRSGTRRREEEEEERESGRSRRGAGEPGRTRGSSSDETWKNFSDLEESLVRRNFSPEEKMRLESGEYYTPSRGRKRGSSDVASMEGEEYDETNLFDEEDEDEPSKRKRRAPPRGSRSGRGRTEEDIPFEEEYDGSLEEDEGSPPRRIPRRGRATTSATAPDSSGPSSSKFRGRQYSERNSRNEDPFEGEDDYEEESWEEERKRR